MLGARATVSRAPGFRDVGLWAPGFFGSVSGLASSRAQMAHMASTRLSNGC